MIQHVVIGAGNHTQSDDRVGLELVEYLEVKNLINSTAHPFEAVDVNGDSLKIFYYFTADIKKMLIIDAVKMGLNPGEYKVFAPSEVVSEKEMANFSSHEDDILKIIALGRELGYPMPEIKILGIEPESCSFGFELTPKLKENFSKYVEVVMAEVASW